MPDFSFEDQFKGAVCGLDEVGRAPLAGPVVAACVYIPPEHRTQDIWAQVNDSKAIAKSKHAEMSEQIKTYSIWALAEACPREVERLNIVQASFLAMRRAFDSVQVQLERPIDHALIDGHLLPNEFPCPASCLIKGDQKSVSIAAASLLAKYARDQMMKTLAEQYPYYGWDSNAGYPTRQHLDAIDQHGITDHHRRSFAPVRNYIDTGATHVQMKFVI